MYLQHRSATNTITFCFSFVCVNCTERFMNEQHCACGGRDRAELFLNGSLPAAQWKFDNFQ